MKNKEQLPPETVANIVNMLRKGNSGAFVAKTFGIYESRVQAIKNEYLPDDVAAWQKERWPNIGVLDYERHGQAFLWPTGRVF